MDVWVVRDGHRITVLITNHAQPRQPIATELVHVQLTGAVAPQAAHIERIDGSHANPHGRWLEMGAPTYLSAAEVEQLTGASRLIKEPIAWRHDGQAIHLNVSLPPHGVAAITLECPAAPDADSRSVKVAP